MEKIEIFSDSSRGIYIPQDFAESHSDNWQGIEKADLEILLDGPENELYWDTWDSVMESAFYMFEGNKYQLYQNGDLFVVCWDLLTDDERENLDG